MRSRHRFLTLLAVIAIVATACGGGGTFPGDAFAVRASSDLGVGHERLLVGVAQADGTRLGSPDEAVTLEVAPLDEPGAVQTAPGIFTWIVPEATGLYRAEFDFDRPGPWIVTVVPESGGPLEPVPFSVLEDPRAPAIGETVPRVETPTLDDLPLDRLTTDPDPDSRFYERSLADAIASAERTVVVFSTPAYCQTEACGPLLDNVKEIAAEHPDVSFVHVEVYTGFWEDDFVPDGAHLSPAIGPEGFDLPSEPWVFVLDDSGTVTARFEGVMAAEELLAHLP